MARGRMISKSISTSRKFARVAEQSNGLGEFCQLLYPLLVTHADDFGRMEGDPFTVKHLCHPTSARSVEEFRTALQCLGAVELIAIYILEGQTVLQVTDFERHQAGLHKRTKSQFPELPGTSRNFPELPGKSRNTPEVPGNSGSREEKGRELKGRELKRTKEKGRSTTLPAPSEQVDNRSKRPIFTGQRFTVFEWQLDDLTRMLGPRTEGFDLHSWFFTLDTAVLQSGDVIPQRDGGKWLQRQVLLEAERRGITIASDKPAEKQPTDIAAKILADNKAAEAKYGRW